MQTGCDQLMFLINNHHRPLYFIHDFGGRKIILNSSLKLGVTEDWASLATAFALIDAHAPPTVRADSTATTLVRVSFLFLFIISSQRNYYRKVSEYPI